MVLQNLLSELARTQGFVTWLCDFKCVTAHWWKLSQEIGIDEGGMVLEHLQLVETIDNHGWQ